jgi:hypothetical protein
MFLMGWQATFTGPYRGQHDPPRQTHQYPVQRPHVAQVVGASTQGPADRVMRFRMLLSSCGERDVSARMRRHQVFTLTLASDSG